MSLLVHDMSIDCRSETHRTQQAVSIIFLLSYGVGIPLGFGILGLLVHKSQGPRREQETFAFFMGGFRYNCRSMCL